MAHGITAKEPLSGIIPIKTAATAIIGLVVWADDADPIAFPANTPVLVTSMTRALSSAGYGGTLRRSLEAMQTITNATMVVIRCTSANKADVIGTTVNGKRTGIQALLSAQSKLDITPKIIVAPLLENPDVDQALIAVAKKVRGIVYSTPRDDEGVMLATKELVVAYRATLGAREIELIFPEFTSGNSLLSGPVITNNSTITLYCDDANFSPDQANATMSVTVNGTNFISEPWTEELIGIEGAPDQWVKRALENAGLTVVDEITGDVQYNFTITHPSGTAIVAIAPPSGVAFRQLINPAGGTVNPIIPNPVTFTLASSSSGTATYGFGKLPTVAVAAALRAWIDNAIGWHKSLSNVAVTGPTGISEEITWDLEDQDTDAGYLNEHQITTLIQHLGFRFWGNRTCSDDPRFSFEVATRTAQVLLDTIIEGCFPFVDAPLTPSLAKDIIDSIDAKLKEFVSQGRLIGASCWYDDAENNAQLLSQGEMWVNYDYTPVPTLENLGLNQRITDRYLVNFADLIQQAA